MMKKIFAFGDSVMKGVVTDTELKNRKGAGMYKVSDLNFINLYSRKVGTQILNFAKFGSTIMDGMKAVEMHLLQISPGDIVVMEFGGNDSDFDWRGISESPDICHLPKVDVNTFRNMYNKMIDLIRNIGATPVILSLPEIVPSMFFEHISAGLDKSKILKWMHGDVNFIGNWHEHYNLMVFKLAAEKAVRIIDISSVFLKQHNMPDFFCSDGMHPNEKGHELIYQTIMNDAGIVSLE